MAESETMSRCREFSLPDQCQDLGQDGLAQVRALIRSDAGKRVFDVLAATGSMAMPSRDVAREAGVETTMLGPVSRSIRSAVRRAADEVQPRGPAGLTTYERAVVNVLGQQAQDVAHLARAARVAPQDVRSALRSLQARGLAQPVAGGGWSAPGDAIPLPLVRPGDQTGEQFMVLMGDAEERLAGLPAGTVDAVVTSPPYWKERDYGAAGQIGWEPTVEGYVRRIQGALAQCGRVMADHALLFLNIDDHVRAGRMYRIPGRIQAAAETVGLETFREVVWKKTTQQPNGTDNAPRHVHEKILVFRKAGARHYWDAFSAREPARSGGMRRSSDVWEIAPAVSRTSHSYGAHFAAFPVELARRCLLPGAPAGGCCATCGLPWRRVLERGRSSWSSVGATTARSRAARAKTGKAHDNLARTADGKSVKKRMAEMRHVRWEAQCGHRGQPVPAVVLDPFAGSGTTGIVAVAELGMEFVGIDVSRRSVALAASSIRDAARGGRS